MYFQQFYLTCLSHASYMLGSEGVACVVDPQRDVSLYLDEARAQGLKIEHIIETHLHADFVSGHVELAAKTGAKIYLGAAADSPLQHVAVHDGEVDVGLHCGATRLVARITEASQTRLSLEPGRPVFAVPPGPRLADARHGSQP